MQHCLNSVDWQGDLDRPVEAFSGRLTKDNAKKLASKWRKRWGLSVEEQIELNSPHRLYESLREFVESLGIFVLHLSFKTSEAAGFFYQSASGNRIVAINTYASSKARKTFTLAHEFCHVLLGKTGISNPSVLKNRVETFCNQFAASLLCPPGAVKIAMARWGLNASESNEFVRRLAEKLGMSQQATVVALIDAGLVSSGYYGKWMGQFSGDVPDPDLSDGQSGGNGDPIKNKKTQYGATLLKMLKSISEREILDDISIFRATGLKPKYQRALFG